MEALSRATSQSEQAWRTMRAANDWKGFLPFLGAVVNLTQQTAQAYGARLGLGPYDALLDGYEPGGRSADVRVLFARLRAFLPDFLAKVVEHQARRLPVNPTGPFPVERQAWLGRELMRRVGFDFTRGRLDTSHHPFCGGVPDDVRITTRYDAADFAKSMMGVLHETGHAKYEQNLPREVIDQPVGAARGMSIHESQSLLLEMQVCRSPAFLAFAAPLIREAFPAAVAAQPTAFEVENLARLATRVRPSYIRVDADECTYPCHILVRVEIEQPLIEGHLRVEEIPEAWDRGMQQLLGLSTRDNYRDGCLQDVHWPGGMFGYFPTYTLGALTAAQLFQAARKAMPTLLTDLSQGHFEGLDAFLRAGVWSQGSLLPTDDLLRRATGAPLDTTAFEAHLAERYLEG